MQYAYDTPPHCAVRLSHVLDTKEKKRKSESLSALAEVGFLAIAGHSPGVHTTHPIAGIQNGCRRVRWPSCRCGCWRLYLWNSCQCLHSWQCWRRLVGALECHHALLMCGKQSVLRIPCFHPSWLCHLSALYHFWFVPCSVTDVLGLLCWCYVVCHSLC